MLSGHTRSRGLKIVTDQWYSSWVNIATTDAPLWDQINKTPWFHSIRLGGVVTPGVKTEHDLRSESELVFKYPITGLSVLDVGAWDGWFSFEAERRGARLVLATDRFSWDGGGWGRKTSFDLARQILGSRVRDLAIDPMEIQENAIGGRFDVVLFLGVLYHLRHPLYVLDRLAGVTNGMLVMETHLICWMSAGQPPHSIQAAN